METWAITGSSGRLGTLLRQAIGPRVQSLVLVDRTPPTPLAPGEISYRATLAEAAKLRAAFRGVNGVIHLAGIPDEADVHDLVETNIVGSYNVLEAARQAGVRRVVLASTGRVIGMYDVREQVDASMQARPDGFYAWTKVAIEALGRLYSDKFNLEVGSVRLGLMAERPMDARALSVWVSPRDAVAAFTTLMTADFNGYVDMFGYSANEHLLVDRTSHEALGFLPADNASDYSIEGVAGPLTSGPQGGFRVTPEYSLKYQHPLE